METILQVKVPKMHFFEKLSLEPCMDVLSQTLLQAIDSIVHLNKENIWKVHLCLTLLSKFFSKQTHK